MPLTDSHDGEILAHILPHAINPTVLDPRQRQQRAGPQVAEVPRIGYLCRQSVLCRAEEVRGRDAEEVRGRAFGCHEGAVPHPRRGEGAGGHDGAKEWAAAGVLAGRNARLDSLAVE